MDKRTKEYKQLKKEKLGLGDAIAKVTKTTGIDKLVEFVAGDDCGCEERKKKLNKIKLPIRYSVKRCFNENQYNQFKDYRNRRTLKSWSKEDVKLLIDLYAHVFAIQYNQDTFCSNCSGTGKILLKIDEHLEEVYNAYKTK